MRTLTIRSISLAVCLSFGLLYGQTQNIASINSSYPVTVPAITGISFSTANLSIAYPVGLPAGSYISSTQLNTDFQAILTAYPNPQDPPEAILSTVLQGILNKYPQMVGGTLSGDIGGTYMGVPIPGGGGTVTVIIGTYNPTTGAIGFAKTKPKS